MIALYVLLAIAVLLFMILAHEFGHYIAGKILKFKIKEFSIGFGFAIFSKTNKKTGEKFSLRIFPLGGYCAFDGEDDDGKNSSPTAFNNQKAWKRIIVLLGGVTMNFITAIIFSWVLLSTIGYDVPQITSYNAAYENPYVVQDVITHVDGQKIDFAFGGNYVTLVQSQRSKAYDYYKENFLDAYLEEHDGAYPTDEEIETFLNDTTENENGNFYTFDMTVLRKAGNGQSETITVKVYPVIEEYTEKNTDGVEVTKQRLNVYIGLESAEGEQSHTTAYVYNAWEGFCRSFEMAFGFAWVVLKSLWMLITFQIPITQLSGTVGTVTTIATMASQSLSYLLIFIPLIAANLAVFNLLPIPSLDGAHVVFTIIEWIMGKPINRKVENTIHFVGLCVLLAFVVVVDILHFVL